MMDGLNFALIKADYEEFLYHDRPILFTGKNFRNDRIVGSFVEHKDEADVYWHSIVDETDYRRFVDKFISYRELLKDARYICRLLINDDQKATCVWITYEDIPEEYLPTEEAMCP